MKKNITRGIAVLAIIFLVFQVIVFAAPFSKNVVFWAAYLFAIIAIAAQVYVFRISLLGDGSRKSKFYGFPIARIGVIYLVVQLAVSLAEMAVSVLLPVWIPLIGNMVLFAAAAIGLIAADAVRDEIVRQEEERKADTANMRMLQDMSASLDYQGSDSAKKALRSLAEEFRYSDPVSCSQSALPETELKKKLEELKQAISEKREEAVCSLCREISGALAERNRICKANKH